MLGRAPRVSFIGLSNSSRPNEYTCAEKYGKLARRRSRFRGAHVVAPAPATTSAGLENVRAFLASSPSRSTTPRRPRRALPLAHAATACRDAGGPRLISPKSLDDLGDDEPYCGPSAAWRQRPALFGWASAGLLAPRRREPRRRGRRRVGSGGTRARDGSGARHRGRPAPRNPGGNETTGVDGALAGGGTPRPDPSVGVSERLGVGGHGLAPFRQTAVRRRGRRGGFVVGPSQRNPGPNWLSRGLFRLRASITPNEDQVSTASSRHGARRGPVVTLAAYFRNHRVVGADADSATIAAGPDHPDAPKIPLPRRSEAASPSVIVSRNLENARQEAPVGSWKSASRRLSDARQQWGTRRGLCGESAAPPAPTHGPPTAGTQRHVGQPGDASPARRSAPAVQQRCREI